MLELSLPYAPVMNFLPSLQASAALHIAREVFKRTDGWNPTIQFYMGYSFEQLTPCLAVFHNLLKESTTSVSQVVQEKWSHANHFRISRYEELHKYIEQLP